MRYEVNKQTVMYVSDPSLASVSGGAELTLVSHYRVNDLLSLKKEIVSRYPFRTTLSDAY